MNVRRSLLPTVLILFASAPAAMAIGFKTQLSCASDYYAFCSRFPVGSKGVRKCMSDNGPKLSKSCINALIADGEISNEEVTRRKEKIASTKATPKPERKIVAAPIDEPKQNVVRTSETKQLPKQQPNLLSRTVTLDQRTYEALKSRGPHFLSDPDNDIPSTSGQPQNPNALADGDYGGADRPYARNDSPTEPSLIEKPSAQSEKKLPGIMTSTPKTTPTDLATTPVKSLKVAPNIAADSTKQKGFTIDDSETAEIPRTQIKSSVHPPGQMGLGRKQSIDQDDEIKLTNSQTWIEYMKNRFNGSMNYEGVDAHFTKRQ